MANLITLFRLFLIFLIPVIAFYGTPVVQMINVPLVILIVLLDGIDGVIARKLKETSVFGAIFDIAVDRIVELVVLITLSKLDLVPLWVVFVFVVRGTLVDSFRNQFANEGYTPFAIMQTPLGKFLVASQAMRFFYGAVKLFTFAWLLLLAPLPTLSPDLWLSIGPYLYGIGQLLVYFMVFLCLLRGIPVLFQIIPLHKIRKQ